VKVAVQPMPQSITAVGSLRSDESITVRPEVAGRISEILFKEGQRVARGSTLVRLDTSVNRAEVEQGRANLKLAKSKYDRAVDLESIDPLKVDFRVPEIYLKQVEVGQTLHVSLDALPGKTFDGKVFAVNPLVDAAGRAIVIRALVRNPDTSLRPGMFARVRL